MGEYSKSKVLYGPCCGQLYTLLEQFMIECLYVTNLSIIPGKNAS